MKLKSVNERIKFIIAQSDLTKRAFSIRIGVDPTVMHNIISGRLSMPSYVVLEKIVLSFDNINARWLLTGKGNTYVNTAPEASVLQEEAPAYQKSTKEVSLENEIMNLKGQIEAYKSVIASLSQRKA